MGDAQTEGRGVAGWLVLTPINLPVALTLC